MGGKSRFFRVCPLARDIRGRSARASARLKMQNVNNNDSNDRFKIYEDKK